MQATEMNTPQPKKGDRFEEVKSKVHTMLVENLNISPSEVIGKEEVTIATHQFLEKLLLTEKIPMGTSERNTLVLELVAVAGVRLRPAVRVFAWDRDAYEH